MVKVKKVDKIMKNGEDVKFNKGVMEKIEALKKTLRKPKFKFAKKVHLISTEESDGYGYEYSEDFDDD